MEGKEIYDKPIDVLCMGCEDTKLDMKPMKFQRRPMGEKDVVIKMKFCGVCHSDLLTASNHLGLSTGNYPMVPGHEMAGVAVACGSKCEKIKVGMQVGIGFIVDSCRICNACKQDQEQKCGKRVSAYGDEDKNDRALTYPAGSKTVGGYSTMMVCDEQYVIVVPDEYPLNCVGPVMCSGITMYDPLKRQGATAGTRVGVVGMGGLGQIGIKIAKSLGCTVTGISRKASKEELVKNCGADIFIVSTSNEQMDFAINSLDLILNTIPFSHDYLAYNKLLTKKGKHIMVGIHKGYATGVALDILTGGASRIVNTDIGGIKATQEVMDICHEHKIYPNIKVVPVEKLNECFELLDSGNDAGFRYVLDIEGSLTEECIEKCKNIPPPKIEPSKVDFSPCSILCDFCFVCCCCKCC